MEDGVADDVGDVVVGERVDDFLAPPFGAQQPRRPQHPEVLGHQGLTESEVVHELVDARRPVGQPFDDAHPDRVGERLQQGCGSAAIVVRCGRVTHMHTFAYLHTKGNQEWPFGVVEPARTARDDAGMHPTPETDPTASETDASRSPEPTAAGDDQPIATLRAMRPSERRTFQLLSSSTAPVWLAMILFPRSRLTATIVRLATPLYAALGVTYTGLLAAAALTSDGGAPRFDDPDSLRAGLSNPTAFLAGWTHYLVFDLYVGRHIWADALERDRTDRLALLLTWMAGPLGLTVHLARRARQLRSARCDDVTA